MGCLNAFFVVWIAGWTWGLIAGKWENGAPFQGWQRALLAAIDICIAAQASYLVLTRRAFTLREGTLILETKCLGFKWQRRIERTLIKSIKQIKDGGMGEDSFQSWGLEIRAPKKLCVIVRQPYYTSLWIGQILGKWSGVTLESATPPTNTPCPKRSLR
jgi:hypothetical protein